MLSAANAVNPREVNNDQANAIEANGADNGNTGAPAVNANATNINVNEVDNNNAAAPAVNANGDNNNADAPIANVNGADNHAAANDMNKNNAPNTNGDHQNNDAARELKDLNKDAGVEQQNGNVAPEDKQIDANKKAAPVKYASWNTFKNLFGNHITSIGTYKWTDKFTLPNVPASLPVEKALVTVTYPVTVPLLATIATVVSMSTRQPLEEKEMRTVEEALQNTTGKEFDAFIKYWINNYPLKGDPYSLASKQLKIDLEARAKRDESTAGARSIEKRLEMIENKKNEFLNNHPDIKDEIETLEFKLTDDEEKEIKEFENQQAEIIDNERREDQKKLILAFMHNNLAAGTKLQRIIAKGLRVQDGKQMEAFQLTADIETVIGQEIERLKNTKSRFFDGTKKVLRIESALKNLKEALAEGMQFINLDEALQYRKTAKDSSLGEALNASRVSLVFDQPLYGESSALKAVKMAAGLKN